MKPLTKQPTKEPKRSGWSNKQRIMFFRACKAADWDNAHRYIVMHHCGCPLDSVTKRPSVKHQHNTNKQLEMVMSFAEPVARSLGSPIRPPSKHKSWEAAVNDDASRLRNQAHRIVEEATRKAPAVFDSGLAAYGVRHVCLHDQAGFMEVHPESIDQCDAPTLIRVIECLRAFVGRRFSEMGINANSFTIPKSAQARAARRTG